LRFGESPGAVITAITLIAILIFAILLSGNFTVIANHIVSLAFLWRLAHNVSVGNQREQSRLVFNKAQVLSALEPLSFRISINLNEIYYIDNIYKVKHYLLDFIYFLLVR
jgi:hypothetical protein